MTTRTVYQFRTQLKKGADHEAYLDSLFADWFQIFRASEIQQRQGIDREFYRDEDGVTKKYTVEYKADERAAQTGNAFIETISVKPPSNQAWRPIVPGWAYTSQADILIYYNPGDRLIYIIQFTKLRRHLPTWENQYREVAVPNKDYTTHGLLVPLAELEKIAEQTINL